MPDPTPTSAAAPAAAPKTEAAPKTKVRTSLKRMRQSIRRGAMNAPVRTATKHTVASAVRLIEEGDLAAAEPAVKGALSTLDRAVAKGVIERNNAARRKSRLIQRLHKAQAASKAKA